MLLRYFIFHILPFSIFNKISCTTTQCSSNTIHRTESFVKSRHLLDDSVLEDKVSADTTSTGSSDGVIGFESDAELAADILGFQGCLRRKTLMKHRRKPTVSSWQRYWVQIWANSLVYFAPKSFKGYVICFKRHCCLQFNSTYLFQNWTLWLQTGTIKNLYLGRLERRNEGRYSKRHVPTCEPSAWAHL